MLSAPTSMAPAASSRSISGRVALGGRQLAVDLRAGDASADPATSNRFFTANGTPASGPSGLPSRAPASSARARGARAVRQHVGERVEHWIALRDARERSLDDRDARCARRRDGRGDLRGARPSHRRGLRP